MPLKVALSNSFGFGGTNGSLVFRAPAVTQRAAWPEDALLGLHARFPDRYPVLLESVGGGAPLGRHDVLLCLPG